LAAQEAKLKETFLEAVEAEKEKLLLAREQGLQGRPTSSSQGKAAHSRLLQVLVKYLSGSCLVFV